MLDVAGKSSGLCNSATKYRSGAPRGRAAKHATVRGGKGNEGQHAALNEADGKGNNDMTSPVGDLGTKALPPGQKVRRDFPRFGLSRFYNTYPREPATVELRVEGAVAIPGCYTDALRDLPRVEQYSDFHCVTTWSVVGQRWGGYRFADVHRLISRDRAGAAADASMVVFAAADGYRSILLLEDLLRDDVLLADELNGMPLDVSHGAPLRLIAPAHYGYKNVKHMGTIIYQRERRGYRFPFPYPGLMDHPRARVALEERAVLLPAKLARVLYRLIIPLSVWRSRRALRRRA